MIERSNSRHTKDCNKDIYNYCKEQGHWAKDCPKEKQETQTKEEQKNNVNYGEAFVLALSTSFNDITWYVDLSA
jgi:putative Mn2+ efflux pump MntP